MRMKRYQIIPAYPARRGGKVRDLLIIPIKTMILFYTSRAKEYKTKPI
jgi:hypothetical protein